MLGVARVGAMRWEDADGRLASNLLSLVWGEAAPDSPRVAFSEGLGQTWCSNAAGITDLTTNCGFLR